MDTIWIIAGGEKTLEQRAVRQRGWKCGETLRGVKHQTDTDMDSKCAGSTNNCFNSPVIVRTGVKYKLSNTSTKALNERAWMLGCELHRARWRVECNRQRSKIVPRTLRLVTHQVEWLHAQCPLNDKYHTLILCPTGFPRHQQAIYPDAGHFLFQTVLIATKQKN